MDKYCNIDERHLTSIGFVNKGQEWQWGTQTRVVPRFRNMTAKKPGNANAYNNVGGTMTLYEPILRYTESDKVVRCEINNDNGYIELVKQIRTLGQLEEIVNFVSLVMAAK